LLVASIIQFHVNDLQALHGYAEWRARRGARGLFLAFSCAAHIPMRSCIPPNVRDILPHACREPYAFTTHICRHGCIASHTMHILHIYICNNVRSCTHTRMRTCTILLYMCTRTHTYIHTYIHTYTHIYAYTHTYIHTQMFTIVFDVHRSKSALFGAKSAEHGLG
jgi:hypothetical protein